MGAEKHGEVDLPITPSKFVWVGNLVLLIALLLVARHWGDWQSFVRLVTHIQPVWILIALAAQIGTYLCVALIWQKVLRRFNVRLRLRHLLPLSIAKFFFDQTLPSFGLSGSLVAMQGFIRRRSSTAAAAAAAIINMLSQYGPYFVLFLVALVIIRADRQVSDGIATLAVIFLAALFALSLATVIAGWLVIRRKEPRWLHRWRATSWLIAAVQDIPHPILKDWQVWLFAGAANAGVLLLDALTLWALLLALDVRGIAFGPVFASFMISTVVATLAFIPGGIGVFEGSSIAILHFFNVPLAHAIAATILLRGLTYYVPLIPGLVITQREFHRRDTLAPVTVPA